MAKGTRTVSERRCPACGGPMVWEAREDAVAYKGHRRTFKSTGWWCTNCGEGLLEGDELSKGFKMHAALRAEVDGVLAPSEVKLIRERLGLSQLEAGRILGGGPRAFQKYESGATPPSVPMAQLLRLLGNDPKRLGELLGADATERKTKASPRSGGATTKGRRAS